ncbi:hypothetical protein L286_11240 [Sphingobium sp. HDIP04]|nr:hypothetical protein L286_11240 [Sphingobium sp. HDIP04]
MMFVAGFFMGAGTVIGILILTACAIWKDLSA